MADIRIFISSPSDVREERKILESVINNDLQQTLGKQHGLTLEPILWETYARPTMGNIQKNIFEQLGDYDIFVGIFWKRFGTPTGEHDSGSEAEFRDAYKRWEADPARPILMYFCEREASISVDTDLALAMEQLQQAQKVKAFREELEGKGLIWPFSELEEFRTLTRNHLFNAIDALVKKPALTTGTPNPAHKTPKPTIPTPLEARRRYLKAFRRDGLQIPLTVLGEDINHNQAVTLDQVFISLNVTQKDHTRLKEKLDLHREENENQLPALEAIKDLPQAVLLGDPGSGKSSFVKHLLSALAAHQLDQAAPLPIAGTGNLLPVLVILRDLAPALANADLPTKQADRQRKLAELVVQQAQERVKVWEIPEFVAGIKNAFLDEEVFLVLDGLDEVPYSLRGLVREAVGAVMRQYHLPRTLVTCRIRSYTGDTVFDEVPTFTLAKLSAEQITGFINNWYEAQCTLGRVKPHVQEARSQDLVSVATEDPLLSLAQNPMLLTTMTIIHQQQARLPDERVRLYKLAVDLLLRRWQEENAGLPVNLKAFLSSEEKVRPALERLAFEAHKVDAGDEAADLLHADILQLLSDPLYLGRESAASEFLHYVDLRSGLLIGRGGTPERYSFPHRTFQEYLAGCYVVGARGAGPRLHELAMQGDFWSEAVLLGIEEQVFNSGSYGRDKVLTLASQLTREEPGAVESCRIALWASKMADVVGAEVVAKDPGDVEPGAQLLTRLRNQCVSLLSSSLPPIERAEAGRTLARLGDPRKELLTLEAMPFCHVPAGPFIMGERKEEHELDLDYPYWISKYPVTQAQFAAFVDAGGYEDDQWWTDAGWNEQQEVEKRIGPLKYKNPVYQLPNHPVVGVMWYEAYAFTRWLTAESHKHGWIPADCVIRLPNEPEWEKAARGGLHIPNQPKPTSLAQLKQLPEQETRPNKMPKRRYPWGEDITTEHCSFDETGIGTTSSPGCFSKGIGPYGLHDQSGNV